jgi:hypothetical protein
MKYIAHRGLTNGPDKSLENNPVQIEKALKEGFDCEIDLWVIHSELWLGHDAPQYSVDDKFIRQFGLWIHAKNLAALRYLRTTDCNYFWHEEDKFTLTSHKFIWTYPGNDLTTVSVMVMPEYVDKTLNNCKNVQCFAICSDYVQSLKDQS